MLSSLEFPNTKTTGKIIHISLPDNANKCHPLNFSSHGFLKFVLYQKFTAENAGFAEFFKFFSAFFALSAVKALFVSTLRKPCFSSMCVQPFWHNVLVSQKTKDVVDPKNNKALPKK